MSEIKKKPGRKPLPEGEKKVPINIVVSPKMAEYLNRIQNVSALVEELLWDHKKKLEKSAEMPENFL